MKIANLLELKRDSGILYVDLHDIKDKYKSNKKNIQKALIKEGYSTITLKNKLYYISKKHKYKLNKLKNKL